MMDTKLTRRTFLGVAGGAAMALAACGGNSGGGEAPAADGGEATGTVGGGTLTVGSALTPRTAPPHSA